MESSSDKPVEEVLVSIRGLFGLDESGAGVGVGAVFRFLDDGSFGPGGVGPGLLLLPAGSALALAAGRLPLPMQPSSLFMTLLNGFGSRSDSSPSDSF